MMMSGSSCSNIPHTLSSAGLKPNGHQVSSSSSSSDKGCCYFQMPLHYPRYRKADYETMPEWKLDCLLSQYGLPVTGDLDHKRKFAMGAFLWPSQNE